MYVVIFIAGLATSAFAAMLGAEHTARAIAKQHLKAIAKPDCDRVDVEYEWRERELWRWNAPYGVRRPVSKPRSGTRLD